MLPRSTMLRHPTGDTVDLPLIVPSFSSKGFGEVVDNSGRTKKTYSEVAVALEQMGPYLTESFLVSAYDIHHKKLRAPERFFPETSLVFVDSGGYELSPEFDSAEPKRVTSSVLPFDEEQYTATLDGLKKKKTANLPLVITNYDWHQVGRSFPEQIEAAARLFERYPRWMGNFLVKPEKARQNLNVDALIPHIESLSHFAVIGVTEKELGKSLLDRLRSIAKLRANMTKRDVLAPIHVWGGLDPLITPLYYFAGADVFDGVSWLRYAFHEGLAVNSEAFPVLQGSITTSRAHAIGLCMNHNLMAIQRLATNLRAFGQDPERHFDVFEERCSHLEKAYRAMHSRISDLKETN